MSDIIRIGEVKAFCHFNILETLDKAGLFLSVVRLLRPGRSLNGSVKGLNDNIFHLVDIMPSDLGDLLLCRDEHDVVSLEELNETEHTMSLSDNHADTLELAYVIVQLISIENLRLLLHDLCQLNIKVIVRFLMELHGQKFALDLV